MIKKQLLRGVLVVITACCGACTQNKAPEQAAETVKESVKEEKSEKYVGVWRCHEHGYTRHKLSIKKVDGKFFIYPSDFYTWNSIDGMNGKVVPAEYDAANDKLMVPSLRDEITYYPVNKSLLVHGRELFREEGQ